MLKAKIYSIQDASAAKDAADFLVKGVD